jgi:hypothetical protein
LIQYVQMISEMKALGVRPNKEIMNALVQLYAAAKDKDGIMDVMQVCLSHVAMYVAQRVCTLVAPALSRITGPLTGGLALACYAIGCELYVPLNRDLGGSLTLYLSPPLQHLLNSSWTSSAWGPACLLSTGLLSWTRYGIERGSLSEQ